MRFRLSLALAMVSTCLSAHADRFSLVGTKGDAFPFTVAHSPVPTYTSTTATAGSYFSLDPTLVTIHGAAMSKAIEFFSLDEGGALTVTDAGRATGATTAPACCLNRRASPYSVEAFLTQHFCRAPAC